MSGAFACGVFMARPNRFRVRVDLEGATVDAHLPNPGRLQELLRPGAALRLVPSAGMRRSTKYDVLAARCAGEWVCLDTRLANAAVRVALEARILPEFSSFRVLRPEVRWRSSRFDFLLENPRRCWLEVKSCSLVLNGCAFFPDAPSARGARHLRELAWLARHGSRAALLFVVVRRAERLSPNDSADPAFGEHLRAASDAGVEIQARRASLRGRRLILGRALPIVL